MYYIGFKFIDAVWGHEDMGEIVARTESGKWEVRWTHPDPMRQAELDHTFETNTSIAELMEVR